ncbi:RimJ/RimL family protein N-acetyltransferase, partial [Streptomyces sp. MBT58]|nr:RimJ/RimL family protein N-acetyltransferase [Streptomyces sp. MBT58]
MPDPNGHPSPTGPYLAEGPRAALRRFTDADAAEFTARARESRTLHHPWLFPPERAAAYAAYTATLARDPARRPRLARRPGSPRGPGPGR